MGKICMPRFWLLSSVEFRKCMVGMIISRPMLEVLETYCMQHDYDDVLRPLWRCIAVMHSTSDWHRLSYARRACASSPPRLVCSWSFESYAARASRTRCRHRHPCLWILIVHSRRGNHMHVLLFMGRHDGQTADSDPTTNSRGTSAGSV